MGMLYWLLLGAKDVLKLAYWLIFNEVLLGCSVLLVPKLLGAYKLLLLVYGTLFFLLKSDSSVW